MKKDKKKIIIGILTLGRTDYSYFKPILEEIKKDPSLDYFLIVAGMHLSPEFGETYNEIIRDGFRINEKIEATLSSDTPEGVAKTTALMTLGMSSVLSKNNLDVMLVLGDRYETLGAVIAVLPYNIPIAHIFGGDITEGAFDEQIRHAITKIAHIHFASNRFSAKRVIRMGEEPWRVLDAGSPSIDSMRQQKLYTKQEFYKVYNFDISKKMFLITFHPVTLECENTASYIVNLIKALGDFDANMLITYPNSDPGSRAIIEYFDKFAEQNKNVRFLKNMGVKGYYSAIKFSDVMIGNSSSGIIESATFRLPVVDIGNRQKRRLAGKNVIHSDYTCADITKKINLSLTNSFKYGLSNLKNPYGSGNASKKIIKAIKAIMNQRTRKEIITKKFSKGGSI